MTDPWSIHKAVIKTKETEHGSDHENSNRELSEAGLEFEDNFDFAPLESSDNPSIIGGRNCNVPHQPLPDSDNYLLGLERKLQKIKKGTKLVESLGEKRQDCLRALLQSDERGASVQSADAQLELDTPINDNGGSAVQEIYRHLKPVQPTTVGELVHIVEYDQLAQCQEDAEETETGVEIEEAKSAEHS